MSPSPTEGFYCVMHFSTDGTAAYVTVGCGASHFRNGSFVRLPNSELDKRTAWARQTVLERGGTIAPFNDKADFGATRPLPRAFARATAFAKRIPVDDLETVDVGALFVQAAERLYLIYQAEACGQGLSPADQDQLEIQRAIRPWSRHGGQGYGLSSADRKNVELRAMNLVREWLEARGYKVTDRSAKHPYDFDAVKDASTLKVEVKGTTSDSPDAVLMTRNEVELHQAEKGHTALFIVSSIRLNRKGKKSVAIGGKLYEFIGWDIDEWDLTPTTYRVGKPQ